jgi:hypothetical protein
MGPAEIFNVLQSNKKVRHGSFKKLNAEQKVIATGFYKEGKKDEAMRVVKLIPQQWLPAVKDGQKVKVRHFHPVTFNLEK